MAEIKFITPFDTDFSAVRDIRTDVFIAEQGVIASQEFDLFDEVTSGAYFAAAYEGARIVGTGRLVIGGKYKIGRIAVRREHRGKGVGGQIVSALLEKAASLGAERVYVDAQPKAVPFYEKYGFKICGKDIIDRGLPHSPMAKAL